MSLVQMLQNQTKVLRAREVAKLFEVTPQHIYKMAASGRIPFFRVAGAIRFDPQELARWLRHSPSVHSDGERDMPTRVA
jgi:excisionase family DNA binding protein